MFWGKGTFKYYVIRGGVGGVKENIIFDYVPCVRGGWG